MSGVLNAVVGAGGSSAPTDAYFNNTTLLLHGDGTNGAQNNTFLDSSSNNFTITRNGNTTQGTFSPFSQTGWSNYFAGSGTYLSIPGSTSFDFGTGDFTIEFWINLSYYTSTSSFIIGQNFFSSVLQLNSSGYLQFYSLPASGYVVTGSTALPLNRWHHVALCRSGNNFTIYLNGTSDGTGTSTAAAGFNSSYNITVWAWNNTNSVNVGYLSNLRFVKGTAVYTSNFTPPTSPLTAITNTSLLTCQSNRFLDNSTNAFAITPSGSPSVQAYSPFAPTAAYSATTNGGSGYFDGSGDYLATPTSGQFTASGDFTVSCWFYLTSFASQYYGIAGNWSAGTSDEWLIQIQNDGSIRFLTAAGSAFSSAGVVKLNQWTYFCATRSGTTVTVQLNGTTIATYTKSDTFGSATKALNIGQQVGNVWPFIGYIADFRLLAGSAITTIPTAPSSASGTSLLLACTNAGIIDNAAKNNLETVGNAQISTTQSKFGSSSMYFDGTGSYLVSSISSQSFNWVGDITLEAWIYPSSLNGSSSQVYGIIGSSASTADGKTFLYVYGNGKFGIGINGSNELAGSAGNIVSGSWQHIAAVRSGSTTTLYVNGSSVASGTTGVWSSGSNPIYVGYAPSSNLVFNGYIDDLRITKGVARYTSNFTVPSAAFPDK